MSVDELRAELAALRGSWEYAFAYAHGCSWGTDPRLDWVKPKEADLVALIQEATA